MVLDECGDFVGEEILDGDSEVLRLDDDERIDEVVHQQDGDDIDDGFFYVDGKLRVLDKCLNS